MYEVALSFAGENRGYVREVACALQARGIAVFYDEFEKIDLWGKGASGGVTNRLRAQFRLRGDIRVPNMG